MNPQPDKTIKSKTRFPIDMPVVDEKSQMFGIPLHELSRDDLLRVIEHLRKEIQDAKETIDGLESYIYKGASR